DLRARPRRWRVPRRDVQRGVPRHHAGHRRCAPAVPAVLLPRRDPEPRRTRDARVDPRGRRARLLPLARLRGCVRQPRAARGRRRRRRRGRDRAAREPPAPQQVPQPRDRRRRPANPTVLARIPEEELLALMRGYGHEPHLFTGGFDDEDPIATHRRFAALLDDVLDKIAAIKARAAEGDTSRPTWPMIILRTPKGW